MSFFISDAVAATGGAAQGSPMSLILMLVVFGLIFYFMILRLSLIHISEPTRP